MESEKRKYHAVCLPFPAQGHINPFLKFAILLHFRGFHITFVNTDYNHRRLLRARSDSRNSLIDGLLGFQFRTIPDGLPDDDGADCTQDVATLCDATSRNCLAPFRQILSDLSSPSAGVPPVTCVVADVIMSFGLVAAEEIGVAGVSFRPTNASSFLCNAHLEVLREKGVILPLKDSNGCKNNGYSADTILADFNIPGLSNNFRVRDFPNYVLTDNEVTNNFIAEFVITETKRAITKASAIIFHTLDSLEHETLKALSATCPPIYPIAPLHLLIDQLPEHGSLKFLGANLWKEDSSCLEWLNSKNPKSVVYVNFGSVAVMTQKQLMEFAWGLANSEQSFLWVVRADGVIGSSTSLLPREFHEETKGRGIIVNWCAQLQVLKHPSVGAFLTHCGWNSMMESIASGVPMICKPFFADQYANCRLACAEWGVGMEVGSEVERKEVEKIVREVMMDGEKGKEMKMKASELKRMAEEAINGVGGSSHVNLDQIVKNVLSIVSKP